MKNTCFENLRKEPKFFCPPKILTKPKYIGKQILTGVGGICSVFFPLKLL